MALLDLTGLSYFLNKLNLKFAPLASPALTGTPTAPTPSAGDDSTKIATTAYVQDALAGGGGSGAYLPLSGGELSGQLDISQSLINGAEVPFIVASASNLTLGISPSVSQYWGLYFTDSSKSTGMDGRISSVESAVSASGNTQISLSAYRYIANKSEWESGNIRVNVAADGTVTTYAPTPPASDDSTQIATTAWVTTKAGNYLPLAGGTMTGAITRNGVLAQATSGGNALYLFAGDNNFDGASLQMFGRSHSSYAGRFYLRASTQSSASSSGASATLQGNPDGSLSWSGSSFKVNGTEVSLSGHTHSYLPLSGGTMTGAITRNGDLVINSVDTSWIRLNGGTSNSNGANLVLYGKSNTSYNGGAYLQVRDGTNTKNFIVKPDGTSTWDGTFTADSTITGSGLRATSAYIGFDGSFGRAYMDSYDSPKYLRITGGSSTTSGAYLDLQNSTNGNGTFSIVTRVSSTNTSLTGNGTTLTWGGTMKAASFQATSDIRKKHNREEVKLDLSSLKAYRYTFEPDGKKHIGLIAQEVEKIIPEAVDTDEEGFKTLDYNSIVALLVSEVNSLKNRIKDLEDGKRV